MITNNQDTLIFSNPYWKDKEVIITDNELTPETTIELIKYFSKVKSFKFFLDEEAKEICTLQKA